MNRFALVLSAVVVCAVPIHVTAQECTLQVKAPSTARTFARTTGQSQWKEFRNIGDVPALELDHGMTAQFWEGQDSPRSVTTFEPGQDFSRSARYCFNGGGVLEGMSFEIRTELGWGFRAEGVVLKQGFAARTQEFFDLDTGRPIAKPGGVGTVPIALKPTLYLKVSELPFASLLATTTVASNRQSR